MAVTRYVHDPPRTHRTRICISCTAILLDLESSPSSEIGSEGSRRVDGFQRAVASPKRCVHWMDQLTIDQRVCSWRFVFSTRAVDVGGRHKGSIFAKGVKLVGTQPTMNLFGTLQAHRRRYFRPR